MLKLIFLVTLLNLVIAKPSVPVEEEELPGTRDKYMDDDDIEDDLPAFAAHQKIHAINETNVGLQFVRGFARSIDATSPMEETPEIQKARSVLEFSNMKNQILVRVSIPGPYNESHVLPIDRDSYTLTLLDMVALLNRKKVYC